MLRRGLVRTFLASVVVVVSLLVVLVGTGVLAPADTGALSRSLQPFAGLAGTTERLQVLGGAVVLLLLAVSTFLSVGSVLRAGRRR